MTPRSVFQPVRKGALARYERILRAARDIIIEQGSISPLSINQLANRSGVSRVSIYYFFESTDQVLQVLYDQAVESLEAALTEDDISDVEDWEAVVERFLGKVIDYYHEHPVAMILSLAPVSFTEVNQQNRRISASLFQHLVTNSRWEQKASMLRACEIAVEVTDAVMRKSFIEEGHITAEFQQDALIAFISFIKATNQHQSPINNKKEISL